MATIDQLPSLLPSLLAEAADAARNAYEHAMATLDGTERRRTVGAGADGTETYLLDVIVERPILDVLEAARVNVLSEEVGWIDRGSAVTIVMDPVDGTANAAAGVPICGLAAAAVIDGQVEFAHVEWFDAGKHWTATRGEPSLERLDATLPRRRVDVASASDDSSGLARVGRAGRSHPGARCVGPRGRSRR